MTRSDTAHPYISSQDKAPATDCPSWQAANITLFTSFGPPLAKQFTLHDGHIRKTSMASLSRGTARTIAVPIAAALDRVLRELTAHQAISTGLLRDGDTARIGPQAKLRNGEISRSLAHFHFPEQQAGWLLWDYDSKSMPAYVAARVADLGGPLDAFFHLWPEARKAAYVVRPSSSDGVALVDGEPARSSGLHGYVLVADIARSRQILTDLQCRAWAKGLAWCTLSASGAVLIRSIVDVAVASPERLIFEAAPIVLPPLVRHPGPTLIHEGTAVLPPILADDERHKAARMEAAARQLIKPDAKQAETAWFDRQVEREVERRGRTRDAARRIIGQRLRKRILDDDAVLDLADGRTVTVAELFDEPERYDHLSIPDPIEGSGYGPDKATLLLSSRPDYPDDEPCIVSHAHGVRTVYRFARYACAPIRPRHPMPTTGPDRGPALAAIRDQITAWGAASDRWVRSQRGRRVEVSALARAPHEAAPKDLVSGAQGVGKTAAVVGRAGTPGLLHHGHGYVTALYSIDHGKSSEAFADFEANRPAGHGLRALHLRGRSAPRPDGQGQMCWIAPQAEAAARQGLDVQAVICRRCPFADDCPYLAQLREVAAARVDPRGLVIFAVHDHAFTGLPGGLHPDRVIFDERPRDFGKREHVVPQKEWGRDLVSLVIGPGMAPDDVEHRLCLLRTRVDPMRRAIGEALNAYATSGLAHVAQAAERLDPQASSPVDVMRRIADMLRDMRDSRPVPDIGALLVAESASVGATATAVGASVDTLLKADAGRILTPLIGVFDAVAAELAQGHGPGFRAVHRLRLAGVDSIVADTLAASALRSNMPLLHLDGTADPELAKAWFGADLKQRHIPVERLGEAVFITGHGFSTSSLTGHNPVTRQPWYPDRADALRKRLHRVFARHPGSFVAMPKPVLEMFGALPGHKTAHFGALRGRNLAEGCTTGLVVGRNLPPVQALERLARAFAVALDRPFASLAAELGHRTARYPRRRDGLRMRDGSGHAVELDYHPDPTAEALLRQIRDAETTQAVDRVRAQFEPKRIIVAGASVPDVTFDRVMEWSDFAEGGSALSRALDRGVLPLSAAELVRVHGDLWRNTKAVQRDDQYRMLRAAVLPGQSVHRSFLLPHVPPEWDVCLVRYTRPATGSGRGQRARNFEALVLAAPEAAMKLAEAKLGPLASCRAEALGSAAETAGHPAANADRAPKRRVA